MALTNREKIWSAQTLVALRASIVFGSPQVTNRNFQGEIRRGGDRVTVTGVVDPTIFDVPRNADIPAPETLTDEEATLVIDQSKGFNFQVDDLDQLQVVRGRGLLLQSAQNAAQALAVVADRFIAGKMISEAHASNQIGSAADPIEVNQPTQGNPMPAGHEDVYRVLTRLGLKLTKANVPLAGRWAIIPSFAAGLLANDPRFMSLNGGAAATNGRIGTAGGFNLFVSDAAALIDGPDAGTDPDLYRFVAGTQLATSYAEQLVSTELYRPDARFADAAKGQHVYGAKTFYPKALAVATVADQSGISA